MPSYKDCLFFAEKTSARVGAPLAGTVLVAARKLTPDLVNGSTIKAIGVPRGAADGVPVATWVSVDYLARKCVEISEADARAIQPRMFEALETFDRSAFYRVSHACAIAEAIVAKRYNLQPADAAVIARLPTTVPEETSQGYRRKRGNRAA